MSTHRKKPKTFDPACLDLVRSIINLSIRITRETPAEIYTEYHGNFDSLRVYAYTMGEEHYRKTRNYMESRWITSRGGTDIEPDLLQKVLDDLVEFGKEVGFHGE